MESALTEKRSKRKVQPIPDGFRPIGVRPFPDPIAPQSLHFPPDLLRSDARKSRIRPAAPTTGAAPGRMNDASIEFCCLARRRTRADRGFRRLGGRRHQGGARSRRPAPLFRRLGAGRPGCDRRIQARRSRLQGAAEMGAQHAERAAREPPQPGLQRLPGVPRRSRRLEQHGGGTCRQRRAGHRARRLPQGADEGRRSASAPTPAIRPISAPRS